MRHHDVGSTGGGTNVLEVLPQVPQGHVVNDVLGTLAPVDRATELRGVRGVEVGSRRMKLQALRFDPGTVVP
jgi:hypothetical protein